MPTKTEKEYCVLLVAYDHKQFSLFDIIMLNRIVDLKLNGKKKKKKKEKRKKP